MQTQEQRVIDGDVYDALHFAALATGNKIGCGAWFHHVSDGTGKLDYQNPCCIHGLGLFAQNQDWLNSGDGIGRALGRVGLSFIVVDGQMPQGKTLTFAQFCRRFNLVPDYAVRS